MPSGAADIVRRAVSGVRCDRPRILRNDPDPLNGAGMLGAGAQTWSVVSHSPHGGEWLFSLVEVAERQFWPIIAGRNAG